MKMETFKPNFISKSILTLVCGLSICFTSCGSDDDDDNGSSGSGVKTSYSIVDGQTDSYKYAFSYLDTKYTDSKEVILTFTNLDYKHPETVVSPESEVLSLYIYTTDYKIPTGAISSDQYDVEVCRKHNVNDTDIPYQWYDLYGDEWNHKTSDLVITKNGEIYKIELKDADFLANDPTSKTFSSVGLSNRKTTGSFEFEGSFTDITSIINSNKSED